jgi:hypothetical protein
MPIKRDFNLKELQERLEKTRAANRKRAKKFYQKHQKSEQARKLADYHNKIK